jgi:ATP-dependent exoDNAse (exonuclease V) beta subunit
LAEAQQLLHEVDPVERERLGAFAEWFRAERALAPRASVDELIERVLGLTGYDLHVLTLAGGERRLANVRKLMRLGREYAVTYGRDLRGFLEFVQSRVFGGAGAEESEAPVEGEALDAVRLMTIHRAKGLEFPIVCVADLGRETPRGRSSDLIVVGRDGRVGLRLARPGTAKPVPILEHRELCEQYQSAEADEERRLFYVAMTRARERLILSGAARLEPESSVVANDRGAPIGWIARALATAGVSPVVVRPPQASPPTGTSAVPVPSRGAIVSMLEAPPAAMLEAPPAAQYEASPATQAERSLAVPATQAERSLAVPALSYSSLTEFRRCGYRFYMERVLGVPSPTDELVPEGEVAPASEPTPLTAAERGVLAHALLEALDFAAPVRPSAGDLATAAGHLGLPAPADEELSELVAAFAVSPLARRLADAAWVRREQRFAFVLDGGPMITGILDVVAGEAGDRMLVVDYKSDRLEGLAVEELVASAYSTQRLLYALAALRAGAVEVEVAHAFLELPHEPAVATFTRAEMGRLERELAELADAVKRREFVVSERPGRAICHGCPAEGTLCPWPLDLTRR